MYMCGTLLVFHTSYSWHDDDTIVDYWTCVLEHSSLGWRGEQSFNTGMWVTSHVLSDPRPLVSVAVGQLTRETVIPQRLIVNAIPMGVT